MIRDLLTTTFGSGKPSTWYSDTPIREELFSVERLEQHAESLARAQAIASGRVKVPSLTRRLRSNAASLLETHLMIAKAVDQGRSITPAAEWLVDNYHIIEAQIREIEADLPPGYYRLLPKLASGPFAGYPCVFGLSWAFIAHTDSHFEPKALLRFVTAYQRVQPLTIGELWAVAITIRIVLVENLRRSATRIIQARAERQLADELADRLLGINGTAPEMAATVLQPYADSMIPAALAVQLVQRLRDQDPRITPALEWLDRHLAKWGTNAEAVVRDEHNRQGASNVTVRNIILSMRLVSDIDWADFVETVSLVDATLRIGTNFAEMDFPTRNLYRSAIEEMARGSGQSELDIARAALAAAARAQTNETVADNAGDRRQSDPGYYLISAGREALEAEIGFRGSWRLWLRRQSLKRGIGGYVAATAVMALIMLLVPLLEISARDAQLWLLVALGCLGFFAALDLATALINRDVTTGLRAIILPGLELAEGIPADLRSIVVIPTLLTSKTAINEQIERLEVHYLTSPVGEVYFALLADLTDAFSENLPGDDDLIATATAGIARLNHLHGLSLDGTAERPRFFLLHRHRQWNAAQDCWMGWERKRGKLDELNRLLRGATDTSFAAVGPGLPVDVRYVITLDADTRLPREAIRRLISKMAHPLNRPYLDPQARRVTAGYGILQPRVTPSLPIGHEGSLFQRIVSSPGGIDPYAAATSDLYQDLFGEGSYTGKGIYDIDAFAAALAGRIPENAVLSHDLFEGTFARAGLASDIEVVEEFPSRYDVATAREHRWIRGDWQLLPWLLRHFRHRTGGRIGGVPDQLPSIGFWKIADNLRRTLTAPTLLLSLVAGWFLPLYLAANWSLFLLVTIALPILIPPVSAILPRRLNVTLLSHLDALGTDLRLALLQLFFRITFLPHHASLTVDAIIRSLYRLYGSRKNLLEWTTAAQSAVGPRLNAIGFSRQMAGGLALTVVIALVTGIFAPHAWPIAAPLILLWLIAPLLAYRISLSPLDAGQVDVATADAMALRLIARRTWRYFETFVTPAENMLPPDNFQEDPKPVIAHRTSPTNIGLYLLSTVSAQDFGWIGLQDTIDRLASTLDTMRRMERFRGHFFNWYDTQDLRPLDPKYISTVDSGNLAGHLVVLANACKTWRQQAAASSEQIQSGLEDHLALIRASRQDLSPFDQKLGSLGVSFDRALAAFSSALSSSAPADRDIPLQAMPERLDELARLAAAVADHATRLSAVIDEEVTDLAFWIAALQRVIASHLKDLRSSPAEAEMREGQLSVLENAAQRLAEDMEFGFLLDRERSLLSIGYLVNEGVIDVSCYDLLASEARLASLFAIAKGDVPTRHWFRLGRTVTPVGAGAALVSWSGSMFEYLMPSLIMRAPLGSLLEQTGRLVVQRQIGYATKLSLPWGISESAYNARDLNFTYQYSSFGVPGLGLKRGLGETAVIAPYATALAAMIDPAAAMANFTRLAEIGGRGRYGYYEALDFTRKHLRDGEDVAIIRAYMAHHQGMSIVSIANVLFSGRMRSRFHAEPMIQASELLLQERTPRDVALERPKAAYILAGGGHLHSGSDGLRHLRSPHDMIPAAHLLSNGRYAVMITAAGSGYSRWKDLAITRWREDVTRDDWGSYIFLRNMKSGTVWSAGFQPTGVEADRYRMTFSEDRAELVRWDGVLTTSLEILISAEDDAEVRQLTISNAGTWPQDIEITSYAELVLAPAAADMAHPAFSKLFVVTEYLADIGALVATRRRRSPQEPEIWVGQILVVAEESLGSLEVETDRSRFIGRGRTIRTAQAMEQQPLSGTTGTTLDPIFALRRKIRIPPRAARRVALWTMIAPTRQALLDLIDKHQDANAFQRASTLAWTQAQVQLRHLGIEADQSMIFQRMADHILYANGAMRPGSDAILRGRGSQSDLWQYGISGDLPIVLVRIDDIENVDVVEQLLRAHEYWRLRQLAVDLVILNERASSYVQDLQIALETAVRASQSRPSANDVVARGAAFVLRSDLISVEARNLLAATARLVLVARSGSLADQMARLAPGGVMTATTAVDETSFPKPDAGAVADTATDPGSDSYPGATPRPADLDFFNGHGGFSADGTEYVTAIDGAARTPAPWINVIANAGFGFQVATEGSGYTWSANSREHQLTPWSNDPVSDPPGEVLYIRDEVTGEIWGPTALPVMRPEARYMVRHGRGYSRFHHLSHGIELDLLQFVPVDDPVKISRLRLRNLSGRPRRLSVTGYVDWVLGSLRETTAPFTATRIDAETGALFAQNSWNTAFKSSVAFIDLGGRQTEWTGDRREFIGRNRLLDQPAALASPAALSGRVGAGLDPCGVLKAPVDLAAGASIDIVFLLGDAASEAEARALIAQYRTADLDAVLGKVTDYWRETLTAVQVKTPDHSMDILLNGWLLYQTLACRFWARSAFYQASGAYGFRDQLQDGMALMLTRPMLTRQHLLRAAGRQFPEGDLQHWWLPPAGQGVRTHISDDRVWLAYAAMQYVETTGDLAILDETIAFLDGPMPTVTQHDVFFQPMTSETSVSLYEHCALALDRSLAVGSHGLPLMGTGDWNDGMNRVGEAGKGESVWLAWFLHTTLTAFSAVATARGDLVRSTAWQAHGVALKKALEREAWDGAWYKRGFFDDGSPLGSAASTECQIDSIAQSWAVLSGASEASRAKQAMASLDDFLIRYDDKLALLFTPPFDLTTQDPGYIKGYPPGIRENGGQYTHAAAWTILALTKLGHGNKAADLFSLLNPINHATTAADTERYKVEPYVIAADVYSVPPHEGRGGWTWYTGSAGWMYRAGIEGILGLRRRGQQLLLEPCVPTTWPGFEITFRFQSTSYRITVTNPQGVERGIISATFDDLAIQALNPTCIPLIDDKKEHLLQLVLGRA